MLGRAAARSRSLRQSDGESANAAELGVGAIMGSGLIAFLVIPSVCSLFAPEALSLKMWPVIRDGTAYALAAVVLLSVVMRGAADLGPALLLGLVYSLYIAVVVFAEPLRLWWQFRRSGAERPALQRSQSVSSFRERYEGQASASFIVEMGVTDAPAAAPPAESSQNMTLALQQSRCRLSMFRCLASAITYSLKPLEVAMEYTCPDCRILEHFENLYPITFFMALLWITVFSFVVTTVCGHWVDELESPGAMGFLGLAMVALGAEVPDLVQAVTVARRGYGGMACSACMGSQIVNVCIGLGFPWVVTAAAHRNITFHVGTRFLSVASACVLSSVVLLETLLIGAAVLARKPHAIFAKWKAILCLSLYAIVVCLLGVFTLEQEI